MRRGEAVELEIPSAPEYITIVRYAVRGIAQRMHFSESQVQDLNIAVGEACANAVKHGSGEAEASTVEVRCVSEPDCLTVEIRNHINGSIRPHVPELPDITKEGGLGLYLMKRLMDSVEILWEPPVATVRMKKLLGHRPVTRARAHCAPAP